MTIVKICGITGLEQALHALEAGADQLGFVLAPSRRQLPPEAVAEIVHGARLRFPPRERAWQAVGVFANQPLEFVAEVAALGKLDLVQLSGEESEEYCCGLARPLYKTCHVGPLLPKSGGVGPDEAGPARVQGGGPGQEELAERLRVLRDQHGATRILLDSGGPGCWGGTGQPFPWDLVGTAARECLVAGGLSPENVARAIATMQPWGVDVSSGVERSGKKDPLLIRAFIAEVRRCDDRG